jgi:hypothetical protein
MTQAHYDFETASSPYCNPIVLFCNSTEVEYKSDLVNIFIKETADNRESRVASIHKLVSVLVYLPCTDTLEILDMILGGIKSEYKCRLFINDFTDEIIREINNGIKYYLGKLYVSLADFKYSKLKYDVMFLFKSLTRVMRFKHMNTLLDILPQIENTNLVEIKDLMIRRSLEELLSRFTNPQFRIILS